MFTLKNDSVLSSWNVDLEDYNETESFLPMNGFNLRNDSSQIAYVDLDGRKVGEVQRYSSDGFMGRPFSILRVYNPDGNDFAINDLFIQVSKDQVMSSQPFNPQWDVLEDDFDRYATGCDSRITFSSTTVPDLIKYWLNVQSLLIVQRKFDVLGGAAVGEYELNFGGDDIVSGSTAIDFPTVDSKRYRKTISNSSFDYTLTNCTVKGWMIDYKLNETDISNTYVPETGTGSNPLYAYDDDLTTKCTRVSAAGDEVIWEVSFPSIDIDRIHSYFYTRTIDTATYTCYLEAYYGDSWNTVTSKTEIDNSSTTNYYAGLNLGLTDVTGLRFRVNQADPSSNWYLNIYDISVFT